MSGRGGGGGGGEEGGRAQSQPMLLACRPLVVHVIYFSRNYCRILVVLHRSVLSSYIVFVDMFESP